MSSGKLEKCPFWKTRFSEGRVGGTGCPILEFMRAREPGLQAPSNLAGSKIETPTFFWSFEFFSKLRPYKFFTGSKSSKIVAVVLK